MFTSRGVSPPAHRKMARAVATGVVGLSMLLAANGTAQAAEPKLEDGIWEVKKEKSVRGVDAKPVPWKADPAEGSALQKSTAAEWPAPGVADLAVPQPKVGTDWGTLLSGQTPKVTPAKAGTLPVWVGPTAGAIKSAAAAKSTPGSTPSRVKVEMLGRRGDQLVFRIGRTDGLKQAGQVSLGVDYSSFKYAYGGDWSARLRLVRLPDCALTTPSVAGCSALPVPTRNDGSGRLFAEVPAPSTAGTYAVAPAADGGSGDFKATKLSPTATWQVGGSSGDFNWSYPMEVPPSIGGPVAKLTLDYSSGGVDGRTSATNNQTSWVGAGFDLSPGGSIERKYASCASTSEQTGNNGTKTTGDLCFATDNATFSLNGKGGELIRDDATGTWRPRNDDGSTIERLSGADNGDDGRNAADKGEYWRLTDKDGTQYYFGLNKLPGATTERTNSSWTVPVFGNHAGEQCNSTAFGDSWCNQTYKWNLDYIVDRHGNTMTLFYDVETNNYARNFTPTTVNNYVRAGNIKRIEYGQRDGAVFTTAPVARVVFDTAERCLQGTACAKADYPDTPFDQECTSTTSCPNKHNPTFWTQKRLAKVTTEIWRGTKFDPVDSWTPRFSYLPTGDGSRSALWLDAISNEGLVGGQTPTPEVNFDGVQKPNRVAKLDGLPDLNWWRVSAVHYGTGGELAINYSGPDCTATSLPQPETNGRRCSPMKWTPEGQAERQDWFHKYVVTDVTENDLVSGIVPVVTEVEYIGPAAWRHDEEDGLVEIGRKTWSQWRGYEKVRVTKGHPDGEQSVTEQTYFRGMDGDKSSNGTVKDVYVTDSAGAKVEDANPLAGKMREQRTLAGTEVVNGTITDQWVSTPTATRTRPWGTTQSFQVNEVAARQTETITGGAVRSTGGKNTYDASGSLLMSSDLNNVADSTDDTCTRYEYATNPAVGIKELPARKQTVKVACDKPWTNADVLTDERVFYDNSTNPGGTPTKGDATKRDRLFGFDSSGAPIYQVVSTQKFDAIGRTIAVADPLNRETTTTYSPANGPVTKTVLKKPNGHTTSTEFEPAWGQETVVTDAAGRRTEADYDPLGRTTKVWMPGRATTDEPNMEYGYTLLANGASVVSTKSLQADGTFETTYELSDGLLRPRQTQQPAPGGGRMVTDHMYDSRGLETKINGPYYNDAPPGTDVLIPREEELPTQKLIDYDAAERPTVEKLLSSGIEKWRTLHSYTGDKQTDDPPAGEQATTKVTNSQGQLTELLQYKSDSPTGVADKTAYTYTELGQLETVKDPAGNQWSYSYDVRGRKITENDPDKGLIKYGYNDADQLTSIKDERGVTVTYAYDEIGRKTEMHEGTLQGPLRAKWTYDTLAVGSPTTATRYVDGKEYTTRVTGYDPGGRPLGTEIIIPDSEGALGGTYQFAKTYNADGQQATSSLPEGGGLPAETLEYGYNEQDLPTTLKGADTYVTGTSYTPFGEMETLTLAQTGGKWMQHKFEYEAGTRRLARVVTERETLPRRIANVSYEYDPSGNVKKITDTPSSQTGEATDTQCFDYDSFRRLTSAWTPASNDCAAAPTGDTLGGPAPYWQSWTFDATGNRKSQTSTTPAGTKTSTYAYPAAGQAHPHALQKVTTTDGTGTKVDSYGYDEIGNMNSRTLAGAGENLTWDPEGKLQTVTAQGKETSYIYDAEGSRLLRRDASGTTLYLGETELLLQQNGAVAGTRYYNHNGQTVGVRTGNKVTWLGVDNHGTPTIAVDSQTQQVQRKRSTPYGEVRGAAPASWAGQRDFVGGTSDPSTGLVHLGMREYDPATGRFISVDPVTDFKDPQQLNGYAYANNSPVSASDPNGDWGFFTSIVNTFKTVTEVVVQKTTETVKSIVNTVTPIVNWVKDKATETFNAVKTYVEKKIEVVKQVIKEVKKVIQKKIKEVKRKIEKIGSDIKRAAKKLYNNAKTAVGKAVDKVRQAGVAARAAMKAAAGAVGSAVAAAGKWVADHKEEIIHHAISFAVGAAAGAAGAAFCGITAGFGCAVIVSGVIGMAASGAANIGAAAVMGEEVTAGKVVDWTLGGLGAGSVKGVRAMAGISGLQLAGAAGRGTFNQTLGLGIELIKDPKMWKITTMWPK
jgi:RHS repeat-associated protein